MFLCMVDVASELSVFDVIMVLINPDVERRAMGEFSGGVVSQCVPCWHSDRAETERSSWPERLHDIVVLSACVAHVMIG